MTTIDYAKRLLDVSNASANFHANFTRNNHTTISHTESSASRPISAFMGGRNNNHLSANQKFFRPQTAIQQSQSAMLSARTAHSTIDTQGGRGLLQSASQKKEFGIEGYKLPQHGLPPRQPKYTIPKDKLSNFLQQTQKRGKMLPAPNTYQKPLSWETTTGHFGKAGKRKTFTDEIQTISRTIPSSASYTPTVKRKIPMGKVDKAECVDFLSEVQYLGKVNPSPAQYAPNNQFVMRRSTSFNIIKSTKESKGWKPIKSKEPDVGSYGVLQSTIFTKERHPSYAFPKSKSLKFTVVYSNQKKHVPGAGNYKVEKCYDKIARPYMKKRC